MFEVCLPLSTEETFEESGPSDAVLSSGESLNGWTVRDVSKRWFVTYPIFNCRDNCDLKIVRDSVVCAIGTNRAW